MGKCAGQITQVVRVPLAARPALEPVVRSGVSQKIPVTEVERGQNIFERFTASMVGACNRIPIDRCNPRSATSTLSRTTTSHAF